MLTPDTYYPYYVSYTTAAATAASQGYKYRTLHPACGTLSLLVERVNQHTPARPQLQDKTLRIYS